LSALVDRHSRVVDAPNTTELGDKWRYNSSYKYRHPIPLDQCFSSLTTSSFTSVDVKEPTKSTTRNISSVTEMLPEFVKQYSIWGGSAVILKTFHSQGVPYWGCMSLTNLFVRTSLFPIVIKGAKTSIKISKVAPEVQFLLSNFVNDGKKLKEQNARPSDRFQLLYATYQSFRGIYKIHEVNPLDVFKSPLMQIPVYWYFSVDIRKLINGGDPELAQELTENGFLWITDLTEPDPWYGLPVLCGLFLYLNVEIAVGKQSLSGETASKSNLARYLKDGFQSLAVLMPCFTSHSPAGVQIYLLTSFIFTLFQGVALRNDGFRGMVGLPSRDAPPAEGKLVNEFILLHKLGRETYGVLAPGAHASYRPYAQMFSKEELEMYKNKSTDDSKEKPISFACIQAPEFQPSFEPSPTFLIIDQLKQLNETKKKKKKTRKDKSSKSLDALPGIEPSPDEVMHFANLGQRPPPPIKFAPEEAKGDADSSTIRTKLSKKKKRAQGRKNGRRGKK